MATSPRLEFGYGPPAGERQFETIRPNQFVADLHSVLDVATQNFSSLWIPDHIQFGTRYRLECWTMLTWLAARYPNVKLGTIVMANSFRHPAMLAKMAATVQTLSGGRFILGYGAGWHEEEYRAYGYDYPSAGVRVAMLEEGIQVIRALWTQSPANFQGKYYHLTDAYNEPRPDPVPIVMIGGGGEQRTLRVVARHADWWNDVLRPPAELAHKLAVLRQHCEAEGRDYESIPKSVNVRIIIDRSHHAALARADAIPGAGPMLKGDPAAIRDQLHELADLGVSMFQVVLAGFPETDDLRLFVDEVMPAFS